MKIVVTADTHIKENSKKRRLPDRLLRACTDADLIIHAGDWQSTQVHTELSQYAEVLGVWGNADSEEIKNLIPEKDIVEVAGRKIGIVHGHGDKKTTEKRVEEAFRDEEVDIIIFGHSHIPMIRYAGKTLLINPGSPTDKRRLPYFSYALLKIDKEIECDIVFFDKDDTENR
ncbi:metallophosphoesterase [Aciduricibacillus chroicocephali]|uniref:Phosphoesterase n=1 Tax=Aciduricibacillus chroicocephali TaxID=3054939 RepID=A0ABY9KW08_9BACI|nr:metallophosphoesterase [Bacillaceae bacterium 44XB]